MQALILLSGCLAAGKTTLAEAIATARADVALAKEDISSVPLFSLWTRQHLERVVILQASFYCATVAFILEAAATGKHMVVADHSPAIHHHVYSRVLWQRGMLSDSGWDICRQLYEAVDEELSERFRVKHLILPADPQTLDQRLQVRRRDVGDAIPLAVIQDYCEAFNDWSVAQEPALMLTQVEALGIRSGDPSAIAKFNAFADA